MERGFKARADRLGGEVRKELGLAADDRLDPFALADEYGVIIISAEDLIAEGASPVSVRQLTEVDRGCFSAGTVFAGTVRLVVYNPSHSDGRRANSLTHEIGHVLLEHVPGTAIGPGGCRVWDRDKEDEADYLAGVLLVPRDAALACTRAGLPHSIGAARFGVSTALMQQRTDHSGASRQAEAEARRRNRALPRIGPTQAAQLPVASEFAWLAQLSASDWRQVLRQLGAAIESGSVDHLCRLLREPVEVGDR